MSGPGLRYKVGDRAILASNPCKDSWLRPMAELFLGEECVISEIADDSADPRRYLLVGNKLNVWVTEEDIIPAQAEGEFFSTLEETTPSEPIKVWHIYLALGAAAFIFASGFTALGFWIARVCS